MIGWIKLHRQLSENPIWLAEPFSRGQAWVDLILLANHKDSFYYKRGIRIDVKRGQLAWPIDKLAERWKWSRGKVERYLNDLETMKQISKQNSNVITCISIDNYNKYQASKEANREPNEEANEEADREANGVHTINDNNVNNVNNEKEAFSKSDLFSHLEADDQFMYLLKTTHKGKDINRAFDECYLHHSVGDNPPKEMKEWKQKLNSWLSNMRIETVKQERDPFGW